MRARVGSFVTWREDGSLHIGIVQACINGKTENWYEVVTSRDVYLVKASAVLSVR